MNRINKMNQVRSICKLEQDKRGFFYRDEILTIIETILDRDLTQVEEEMSIKGLVKCFLPGFQEQSTAVSHPSVNNVDCILGLLEDSKEESEEESEEDHLLETVSSPVLALTDFIIQGLNEKFSHNILAVSVCANNPKQFTITLK